MSKLEDLRLRHNLKAEDKVEFVNLSTAITSDDEYSFTSVINTDAVDRDRQVVLPDGCDLSEFMKSGVICWNHDYDKPCAMPNKSIKVARNSNSITISARFLKRPDDYQGEYHPDFVRSFVNQSVKAGVYPGISVGLLPLEIRNATIKDKERFGKDVKQVISKWKLLEYSICPVQSNPEAYIHAISKGLLSQDIVTKAGIDIFVPVKEVVKPIAMTIKVSTPQPPKSAKMTIKIKSFSGTIEEQVDTEILRQFGRVYK